MERMITYLLIASLGCGLGNGLSAQAALSVLPAGETTNVEEVKGCQPDAPCISTGEALTYKIYYNWSFFWVPAGEVTFSVHEHSKGYHLMSEGSSYSSYEWFFKVDNRYESIIDKETFLPIKSVRDISEGNYRRYDEVEYNRSDGKAIVHRAKHKHQKLKKHTYEIASCVHDLLSIIYYARSHQWSVEKRKYGERIPVDLFFDKKQYDLHLEYREHAPSKQFRLVGEFDALRFVPELITGEVFDEDDQMNIWVSNDKNKMPLLIESPLSVGKVKAVLKNYRGLKYPLESKQ